MSPRVTFMGFFYARLQSAFGTFSIVWKKSEKGPKVYRIFFPNEHISAENLVQMTFADASPLSCPAISELGERIQSFLDGNVVDFELGIIALEKCPKFQRKVLLVVYTIPRSCVSTYGEIARSLRIPNSARAVGRALSINPFPIIIPCHRAIMSDGRLGEFQGGLELKQALLKREGIEFSNSGKVLWRARRDSNPRPPA
ncbi:MAG: methylated-DNA--[protein]-cysteine S-methyltransferase [Candidatus Bathyarchaeota archaeon]